MASNLRIGGLSTGMDIDQTVKDLMKAHRINMDGLKQKRQQVEWQRTDYRTVNNSLRALRDRAFSMRLEGPYLAKRATSSNEVAVTAAAGAAATVGTYSVRVNQLAQGVTKGSQSNLPEESNADGTTRTLAAQLGITGTRSFTLEGKLEGGTRKSKSFTIDTATYTVNTLAAEINNAKLGITASYDSNSNRFFLTTAGTGSDHGIRVSSDPNNFLSDATGAGTGTMRLLIQTGTLYSGQNAQFDFGDSTNMTSSTNTVTVNGITLTLKQGGGATSSIAVSRDADAVYNSIKSFIDQYNTTLDLVNKEMAEERYRDFLPLTDAQREKMSNKQQEDWEAKARSGMLRNDSLLTGLVGKMRNAVMGVVSGIPSVNVGGKTVTYNSLSAIGIRTGHYSEGGRLHLDRDGAVLREAIQNDPDGVMMLFNKNSAVANEKGIAWRLYDEVDRGVRGVIGRAGIESTFSLRDNSALGRTLHSMDRQIKEWEKRIVNMEERYWRQFTAMEKAVGKMNSQSAWLAQQFNTGKK